MAHIESGKSDGATVHIGGERHGEEGESNLVKLGANCSPSSKGFFVQPTIFTDTQPHMKIVQEEIFGPVAVLIKFKTDEGERVPQLP